MEFGRRAVLRAAIATTLAVSAGGLFASIPATAAPVPSEDEFFGVWNPATSTWTKEPALDYAAFGALAEVEAAAKSGAYDRASAALLAYYRTREGRTPPPWVQNNVFVAGQEELFLDHFWTLGTGEAYISTLTVAGTEAESTADVTRNARTAHVSGWVGFMLMARHKEANTAEFRSRQAASGGPVLSVTLADGTVHDLAAAHDTYIANGDLAGTVLGGEPKLQVRDEGTGPYGPQTRKAYLSFDLSALASAPTKAVLRLTGRNATADAPKQVVLFQEKEAFDEAKRTWNNTVQNTFSWQGDPGGFDWKGPAGSDPEYSYQLPRFYFAGPVADAYRTSGDERLAAGLLALMTDFIQDAAGYPGGVPGFPRNLDACWRYLNWTYAYDVLRTSASLTARVNITLLRAFVAGARYLATTTSNTPNWMISIRSTLLGLALYFPEFKGSGQWLADAQTFLGDQLRSALHPDGGYVEASSGYAMGVAQTFGKNAALLKANGQSFAAGEDLRALSWYLADQAYPDVRDPSYGDSGTADWSPGLTVLADLLADEELRHVATGGTSGRAPGHTSVIYPVTRTAVQRTGWAEQDLYLRFSADRGPHSVRDDLDVAVYAYGRPLLPEMGAFSYSSDPKSNWLRFDSRSRNTVTVDGVPQVLDAAAGLSQAHSPWFDLADGWTDASAAARHGRTVLFVRGRFWIVSDVLTPHDLAEHSYRQTWHSLPDAHLSVDPTSKAASTAFTTGADIRIVPSDPGPLAAGLDDGYYSPAFYTVSEAKYVSYTLKATGTARLDTLLLPTREGSGDNAEVTRVRTGDGASALRFGAGRSSGWYLHADRAGDERTFGPYASDARVAYAEATDGVERLLLAGGTVLLHGRTPLVHADRELGMLAAELDRERRVVALSGLSAATGLEVAAPWARRVTVDGEPVRFTARQGLIRIGSRSGTA